MRKVNKHFISEIDKQLEQFNATHRRSASQQAEIEKYNKIFELRDNPEAKPDVLGDIWNETENE